MQFLASKWFAILQTDQSSPSVRCNYFWESLVEKRCFGSLPFHFSRKPCGNISSTLESCFCYLQRENVEELRVSLSHGGKFSKKTYIGWICFRAIRRLVFLVWVWFVRFRVVGQNDLKKGSWNVVNRIVQSWNQGLWDGIASSWFKLFKNSASFRFSPFQCRRFLNGRQPERLNIWMRWLYENKIECILGRVACFFHLLTPKNFEPFAVVCQVWDLQVHSVVSKLQRRTKNAISHLSDHLHPTSGWIFTSPTDRCMIVKGSVETCLHFAMPVFGWASNRNINFLVPVHNRKCDGICALVWLLLGLRQGPHMSRLNAIWMQWFIYRFSLILMACKCSSAEWFWCFLWLSNCMFVATEWKVLCCYIYSAVNRNFLKPGCSLKSAAQHFFPISSNIQTHGPPVQSCTFPSVSAQAQPVRCMVCGAISEILIAVPARQ